MASMNANVSSVGRSRQGGGLSEQFRKGTSLFSFLTRKKDGKRKSDPVKVQRERVRQFSVWFQEREKAKDREYLQRRRKREDKREEAKKLTGQLRFLYVPTSFLLFTGTLLLVMSIVPGIGSNTIFWKKREIFHVVGPVILGFGIIMLMVTEAILSHRKSHLARLHRMDDLKCEERRMAISQEPCKHQQKLLDTYFKSDRKCACRFDLVIGKKKPMVSVETQTDDILLVEFVQKTHGRGSFRKPKHKLCKMESVDSAAYSMESSATCFTDLYDADEEEDVQSILEEEGCPLILDANRQLSDIGFVPVVPKISHQTVGPVTNGIPSIVSPLPSNNIHEFQPYKLHTQPIKHFENVITDQSLSIPCEPFRDRANSEGLINQSFQRGISIDISDSESESVFPPPQQPNHAERHLQIPKPSTLNNSVPNLANTAVTSPLLCVDLDTATGRSSWTTFE
ncbi:uncharacterized protein LOC110451726 [Mizuhopecten yessoensis]|uniref:Uncharacterized protein n=1 Tax=Mizuhopecten yessoensis TaxID=6573 RepID=A0A210QLC8_MIZYE|nr:uncharacterized protein LOC110451726 [Mizuhopecten yessoensis]OWF49526.1 hypothetical protein KP79_PYT17490 [Mizuhopecten yessoensis]